MCRSFTERGVGPFQESSRVGVGETRMVMERGVGLDSGSYFFDVPFGKLFAGIEPPYCGGYAFRVVQCPSSIIILSL